MGFKFKLGVVSFALFTSYGAQASQWYVKENALVCFSERAFDEQMQYLSQGVKQFVKGCGATDKRYRIVMLDFNTFSASKAKIVENGAVIWIDQGVIDVVK